MRALAASSGSFSRSSVDAGDLPEDDLARLDGRRRLELLLQRDDVLAVAPAPAEHLGQRVERRGVGGVELEDLPQRGLGLAWVVELPVLHPGQHQVQPLGQRPAGELVRHLLVDRRQLLVGAGLLGQPLHVLAERVVGGVQLERAAQREEGDVLLPELLLADAAQLAERPDLLLVGDQVGQVAVHRLGVGAPVACVGVEREDLLVGVPVGRVELQHPLQDRRGLLGLRRPGRSTARRSRRARR